MCFQESGGILSYPSAERVNSHPRQYLWDLTSHPDPHPAAPAFSRRGSGSRHGNHAHRAAGRSLETFPGDLQKRSASLLSLYFPRAKTPVRCRDRKAAATRGKAYVEVPVSVHRQALTGKCLPRTYVTVGPVSVGDPGAFLHRSQPYLLRQKSLN